MITIHNTDTTLTLTLTARGWFLREAAIAASLVEFEGVGFAARVRLHELSQLFDLAGGAADDEDLLTYEQIRYRIESLKARCPRPH
jgi:hypothetical protein